MRRLLPLIVVLIGLGAAPAVLAASAAAKRDTTRVDVEWKSTVNVKEQFTWSASAITGPPQGCGTPSPGGRTRNVTGSGSYSIAFSTPKPVRLFTVQVLKRAYKNHSERSLSYRPKGAPKTEDQIQLPASVSVAGSFTDEVLACDAFDAHTDTAPAGGCGSQTATVNLIFGWGLVDSTHLNNPALTGSIVKPSFVDADGKNTCPTYASVAVRYFDGGRDSGACPDLTALHPGSGLPETGIAKYFTKGAYYPQLTAAKPKAFTITVDKPMNCTLTRSDSYLPPVAPSGSLTITGSLHYEWVFTPRKATGPSTKVHAI